MEMRYISLRRFWYFENGRCQKTLGLISEHDLLAKYLNGEACSPRGLVRARLWERIWYPRVHEPIQRTVRLWRSLSLDIRVKIVLAIVVAAWQLL